jgi:hypothetical protein
VKEILKFQEVAPGVRKYGSEIGSLSIRPGAKAKHGLCNSYWLRRKDVWKGASRQQFI